MDFEDLEEQAPPPAPEKGGSFRIVLEGGNWAETRFAEVIADRLYHQLHEQVEQKAAERIDLAIDHAVKRVGEDIIRDAIKTAIADGWPKTNQYGEPTGPTITLKTRISDMLESRSGYDRERHIDKLVKTEVEEALRKEFAKEFEEARKRVRTLLDGALNEKLAQALREGLGLK
jgi:hypothetical protein